MKQLTLIALFLCSIGMAFTSCKEKPLKPTHRYFEYGCVFILDDGCSSTSQTTVELTGTLTFDQIKANISQWVSPAKIKSLQVWYLREIPSGEMYIYSEKFSCKNIGWKGIENRDTVKNTNNYIILKTSK